MNAFSPLANSATIAAAITTASAALPGTPGAGQTVYVVNGGAVTAFVRFGTSAGVTATLTDTPIAPNAGLAFSIPETITHVAAILPSGGPQNVTFQRGIGL